MLKWQLYANNTKNQTTEECPTQYNTIALHLVKTEKWLSIHVSICTYIRIFWALFDISVCLHEIFVIDTRTNKIPRYRFYISMWVLQFDLFIDVISKILRESPVSANANISKNQDTLLEQLLTIKSLCDCSIRVYQLSVCMIHDYLCINACILASVQK